MLQQFFRQRDLIPVGNESALESKIEIITLHFCGHARGVAQIHLAAAKTFLARADET